MARLLFGNAVVHDDDPDTKKIGHGTKVVARLRATRTAWTLRRYTPIYTHLTALDDKTIAAVVLTGWGIWVVGVIVAPGLLGPAAWIAGVLLAAAGVYATVVIVGWWMGYRHSGDRLRHQILARDPIAKGRELADHISADVIERRARVLRPTFTAAAEEEGRANALAATILPGQAGAKVKRIATVATSQPAGTEGN